MDKVKEWSAVIFDGNQRVPLQMFYSNAAPCGHMISCKDENFD